MLGVVYAPGLTIVPARAFTRVARLQNARPPLRHRDNIGFVSQQLPLSLLSSGDNTTPYEGGFMTGIAVRILLDHRVLGSRQALPNHGWMCAPRRSIIIMITTCKQRTLQM